MNNPENRKKLSNEDLAALIVDGLVDAKLIKEEDFEEAVTLRDELEAILNSLPTA